MQNLFVGKCDGADVCRMEKLIQKGSLVSCGGADEDSAMIDDAPEIHNEDNEPIGKF